jgi:transporter family-2 protein
MHAFAIPFLLAVGGLLAVQAAANVQLSTALASPVGASTLQLGIGAALLLALTVVVGTTGAFGTLGDAAPWHLLGGLGSAVYITAGILLFPRLGAVVSVGLFVAGQIVASVVLDGAGWLGVERQPIDAAAVVGGLAVIAGAAVVVRAQAGGAAGAVLRGRLGLTLLGLLAGAVLPVQGAVNARLRADLHAPITAGAWSFVVAASAMAVALATLRATGLVAPPRVRALTRVPWWGWLGGLCGATYVTSVFLLIPEIGTAATIALTIGGQQLASLLVDRHGLLRLSRREVTAARLAGVVLMLAGVALVQVG